MSESKSKNAKNKDSEICYNKNATRNYVLGEKFEAGIVLVGTEVKSVRMGGIQVNDAYGMVEKSEVFLHNMQISPYNHGNRFNHEPLRRRKLLLHRNEIRKLIGAVVERGYTLVPTKLYWVKGRVKVELALGKGKTKGDRRESEKKRDARREIDSAVKRSR